MAHIAIALCLFSAAAGAQIPAPSSVVTEVPRPPGIKAAAAILMDADSGQVIYEKEADAQRPPASTTKIMTAILLLEHTRPMDIITASKHASETGGSALNLKAGERLTAHDMLYALMLRSANDGCVAVAEHVAGSEAAFARMMTEKAEAIGATRTTFQNCNGLNDNPNLTTARDLATMARYAFQYPDFCAAVRTKVYSVKRDPASKDFLLKNHAKFLWKFPGADGVKTGYTNPAGHCFVGAATWNGWRLLSVVLHSPDIVRETHDLMKYGFEHFQRVDVASAGQIFGTAGVEGGETPAVTAVAHGPLRVVVPRGEKPNVEVRPRYEHLIAPITAGSPVGTLELWEGGKPVASTQLVAASSVERAVMLAHARNKTGWFVAAGLLGMVAAGYGTTIAKTARIRRYRLQALLRDADKRG